MATVMGSQVGAHPTVPVDRSPRTRSRVLMTLVHVERRMAAWIRTEPRVDAWASYGALGFAGAVTLALLALRSF